MPEPALDTTLLSPYATTIFTVVLSAGISALIALWISKKQRIQQDRMELIRRFFERGPTSASSDHMSDLRVAKLLFHDKREVRNQLQKISERSEYGAYIEKDETGAGRYTDHWCIDQLELINKMCQASGYSFKFSKRDFQRY